MKGRGLTGPQWICLGFFLISAAAALRIPLNQDAGAILQFSGRWLGGERLYLDLFDINPPMNFILSLIPAAASKAIGGAMVFPEFVVLLATAAILLAIRHARPILPNKAGQELLAGTAIFALLAYPGDEFGQREHLLAILSLPYLVLAAARGDGKGGGRGTAIGIALLAFIGFALKPYFALVPLAVEIVVVWRTGFARYRRDPTAYVLMAAGILYLAATALFWPAYFTLVMPTVGRYYHSLDLSMLPKVLAGQQMAPLAIGLTILLLLRRRFPVHPIVDITIAAAIGAILAAICQLKDWDYHFLTARMAVYAAAIGMLASVMARETVWDGPRRTAILSLGVLAIFMGKTFREELWPYWGATNTFLPIIDRCAHGQPVLWLTQYIGPTSPVLSYSDSKLAMPYMSMWMLPDIYANERPVDGKLALHPIDTAPEDERRLIDGVARDTARDHPRLILAARDDIGYHGAAFDYIAYLRRDPIFEAEWRHYTKLTTISDTDIFVRDGACQLDDR
jgi:hypothetical protein